MRWSQGLGFMTVLQRPEVAGDPQERTIIELTRLAGGFQDLWLSISRRNPVLLERPLTARPEDERTIGKHIMDVMDEMGATCESYLDRELAAEEFKVRVRELRSASRKLAADIKKDDLGE